MSVAAGDAARARGDLEAALVQYGAALAAAPGDVMALVNRGVTLHMMGRAEDAAADYARAAELAPGVALIRANLAAAWLDAHKPGSARDAALAAVELDPANVPAWNNLGVACGQLGLAQDARAAWNRALTLDPNHVSTLVNLAQGLRADDPDAAADLFDRALAHAPERDDAYAEAISCLWHACRWARAGALIADLDRRVARGMATNALLSLAYTLPFMGDDPDRVARVQAALGKALARAARPLPKAAPKPAHAKIALGYLSPDFGNHAMSHVLRGLIAAHDKSEFAVTLFSLKDRGSEPGPWLGDLKRAADSFVDLSAAGARDAAQAIRAHGIDVLIDLSGYMAGGRPEILAARPAPVQVYWIGHGGFLEAPYIDYTIADSTVCPDPGAHVEAIARLPLCYHPADRFAVGSTPSRAALGLPETGIVFAAFCNPLKIAPDCFAAWMAILRGVPGSVLWLAGRKAYASSQNVLRDAAREAGVDPVRLIFAPHAIDKVAHLARHRAADLFLDSFAVSAASTALDALSAGLPVLTKRGRQAHANVAASFLNALDLPELIAPDADRFVARAIELAGDPSARAGLRGKLADAVATRIPFDSPRMARHVEFAFRTMTARARARLKPASFDVEEKMKPPAIREFYARLAARTPEPTSELLWGNPYQLLVAVVLSAQATDVGVNKATRKLFEIVKTPAEMVALGLDALKGHVKTIGLFNTKAKNVIALSEILIREYGGGIPRDRERLEELPGVGRKTANVVLNVAFGEPTIAVDTHIFRVGNRTGLAKGKTPRAVEDKLEKVTPAEFKRHAHHWLILHGRYVCKARKPECWRCGVADLCAFKPKTPAP